jgi:hypothetical protein
MTPKEKAEELISKFTFLSYPENNEKFYNPKQCALIAVDEIIQSLRHAEAISDLGYPGYWHKVKIEINKL